MIESQTNNNQEVNYLTVIDEKYDPSVHGEFDGDFEREHFRTTMQWDSFQIHSFLAIKRGDNLIVVAPTSSGKTSVAKYAVLFHLLQTTHKIVYTTPTKSLSNEKYEEMKVVLDPYGINPGLLTGDQKINSDSRFLIMTAEILSNALFMLKDKDCDQKQEEQNQKHYELDRNFVNSIGCVVIDEIHFISDRSRGHIWENTLILLSPKVQIVGLSATIDTPEEFASWIGRIKQHNITLVKKYDRPVPLEYSIYDGQELKVILDSSGKYNGDVFKTSLIKLKEDDKKHEKNRTNKVICRLNNFILYAKEKDLFQLCFIVFSKKNCEIFAKNVSIDLMNGKDSINAVNMLDKKMGIHLKSYIDMPRYQQIKQLIQKGVCFHHAGLPVIIKEIVEQMFKEGYVKVLFATETVAIGVNMPIRTLVLPSVEKSIGASMQSLNAAEFKQICGRAGRRGLDSKGSVVFLPFYDSLSEIHVKNELLFGPMPKIESKMELTYHSYLKLLRSDVMGRNDFFDNSLMSVQNSKIIKGINIDINKYKKNVDDGQIVLDKYIKDKNINIDTLNDLNEHIRLYLISSQTIKLNGFNAHIKQSKQQQQKQKRLESIVKSNKNLYDMILKHNNNKEIYQKEKNRLDAYIMYKDDRFAQITKYLQISGYLDEEGKITECGKMVTFVNECNPFILVEIFMEKIINDMTPQQIVCLLSIFTERVPKKNMDDKMLKSIKIDNNIKDSISYIENRITNYTNLEQQMNLTSEECYWDISYDYLELVNLWTEIDLTKEDHGRILQKLNNMDEYEGSFVKNMLKINNIVENLMTLCNLTQELDMLPTLQEINKLILKGMVNADSLHIMS
jgi:superfamily II RNA helicase